MLICAVLALLMLLFYSTLVSRLDAALADPAAVAESSTAETEASVGPGLEAADSEEASARQLRRTANALPLLTLGLLLLAITRRPLLSLWLGLLAACSLYAIDALKFENLHAHLLPADVMLVPQIASGMDLYWSYANSAGFGKRQLAGYLLITALLFLEPAQRWLRAWLRIVLALLALGLGYAVVQQKTPVAHWYDNESLGFAPWQPDASIERTGLIAGLVKLAGEGPWQLPAADEAFVESVLAMHPAASSPAPAATAEAMPDIIIWQSESLFDPARLSAIDPDVHLRRLNRLRSRGLHGELSVPTYGGGTVRTEFEILTGYPMHAFAGINYPYSALAQRPLMALPRLLRQYGYRTIAIHPYEANFWSRDSAMSHLGFDVFEDQSVFQSDDYHGIYIGDHALLRRVTKTLAADSEQPRFIFAISMENHGPWRNRPRIDEAARRRIPVPDEVSGGAADELRNYLYHVERADRLLESLIELVDSRPRRTIVLFYGDHLPGLERVFKTLRFEDGLDAWEQPVPFLLYDNRGGARGQAGGVLRSYHLASLVLDAAGFNSEPRFRVLSADRERLGPTGLNGITPNPELDYDHALGHLSWYYYRQPVTPDPVIELH